MTIHHDLRVAEESVCIVSDVRSLLAGYNPNGVAQIGAIEEAEAELLKIHSNCGQDPAFDVYALLSVSLKALRTCLRIHKIAMEETGDLAGERERLRVLWRKLKAEFLKLGLGDQHALSLAMNQSPDEADGTSLAKALLLLPIPPQYRWHQKVDAVQEKRKAKKVGEQRETQILAKIIAKIDGHPLVSCQRLRPDLLYEIAFDIIGTGWAPGLESVGIDFLTSCPTGQFSVSSFANLKPAVDANGVFKVSTQGQIRFSSPQSIISEPLSFVVRCAVQRNDGSAFEVPVIGNNQLLFRVSESDGRSALGKYKRLGEHITTLLEDLQTASPSVKTEFDSLVPLLDALTDILGTYAQSALFKGKATITEREFQKEVLRDLRVRLGEDTQEHAAQGGGFTDIRYRGVILELKVEKTNGDRKHICESYKQQPIQYASVEARQVAVVLVLDTTEKVAPPGDVRNDVLLVDVPTHGGADVDKKFPSKAFVLVVNANQRDPSSYS